MRISDWSSDVCSSDLADHDSLKKLLRSRAQDESKTHEINCKGRHQDGKEFNATFIFSPSNFDGEACTQIVIRTESGVDEDTLRQLTQTDPVTGLPNRSWLLEEVDKALAKTVSDGQGSAVFYLRLDNFEQFQSRMGRAVADKLLKKLADAFHKQPQGHIYAHPT